MKAGAVRTPLSNGVKKIGLSRALLPQDIRSVFLGSQI